MSLFLTWMSSRGPQLLYKATRVLKDEQWQILSAALILTMAALILTPSKALDPPLEEEEWAS